MRYLTILAFSSMILSAFAHEEMNAYKLMPESKSCTPQCKTVKKVAVKKTTKKVNKATPAYSKVLKQQAEEMKKMKTRQANLELELRKLREANLILASKQDETPRTTVQLASTGLATQVSPITGASIPVQTTVISTTAEVAKDVEATPSPISGFLGNEIATTAKVPENGRSVSNSLYNELNYKYSDALTFRMSNSIGWNWLTNKETQNEAIFGDTGLWVLFPVVTNPEGFSLKGAIINEIPVSKASRDETKILTSKIRLEAPTTFNNGKGSFRIRTEYAYVFRRYTTPEGTGVYDEQKVVNYVEIGSSVYEKLAPYTIDNFFVRFDLGFEFTSVFSINNEFRWTVNRTYADSFINNGTRTIITPEGINNYLYMKNNIAYKVTNSVTFEAGIENKLLAHNYRPFKDINLVFALNLDF